MDRQEMLQRKIEREERGITPRMEKLYYVLVEPSAVYVKEEEFFKVQGGLTEKWGRFWKKVRAASIEDARRHAKALWREKNTL